jgi:hypothetical protein
VTGVHHVLLLAGDNETPAGSYASSLDILYSDLLPHYGITHGTKQLFQSKRIYLISMLV